MKRVKIMLMSLALLAIVGGALAFKAKLTGVPMCTQTVQGYNAQSFCDNIDNYSTATVDDINKLTFYTTTPDPDNNPCSIGVLDLEPLPCLESTSFIDER